MYAIRIIVGIELASRTEAVNCSATVLNVHALNEKFMFRMSNGTLSILNTRYIIGEYGRKSAMQNIGKLLFPEHTNLDNISTHQTRLVTMEPARINPCPYIKATKVN